MARRNAVFRGLNSRVERTRHGQRISGATFRRWWHPWEIDCTYVILPKEPGGEETDGAIGEWRATVNPGFVNGQPAFIEMPADWIEEQVSNGAADERDFGINPLSNQPNFSAWVFDRPDQTSTAKVRGPGGPVRLTNSPAPYLVLSGWRNPIASSGIGATLGGGIVYGAGEGYPDFFIALGVRPPAAGGKSPDGPRDPQRTRQIRALDVVLTVPRRGSALAITVLDPLSDNFTHQLETTYTSAYFNATEGRAKLGVTSKFRPIVDETIPSPLLGLPINAGDPQIDQLKIATVWTVSPPGYGEDAIPDQTWETYPEHAVFWNLWSAAPAAPPVVEKLPPLKINTGLAFGILDYLANAMLAPINSGFDEIQTYLNQTDTRSIFWNA